MSHCKDGSKACYHREVNHELVVGLRDPGPGVGGKAAGLARLLAAGLPVPDGFVVTHAAFTAVAGALPALGDAGATDALIAVADRAEGAKIPAALEADVIARARALCDSAAGSSRCQLAVRSSVSIEDSAAGAGAGVLSSEIAVDPGDVWPAIRAVWASACTPLVAHYARRRGVARIEIGVVVQRFVAGERIVVYTRPPGVPDGDTVWIERAIGAASIDRTAPDPIVRLALAAEAAIGATATGADVELIDRDGDLAIVQARPIIHPPVRPQRTPPPPALLAPLLADPALHWRWDVEHNPEPLSVAQAGLVAAVDAAGAAPWRMCTVAGYLYATERLVPVGDMTIPASARLLEERFLDLAGKMSLTLERAGASPTVRQAIDAYVKFYAIWAQEVVPLLELGRLTARATAIGSPIARAIGEVARGERTRTELIGRIGDLALAWDVAAPTLAERPELIDAAIAAAGAAPAPPVPEPSRRTMAMVAVELSETDDLWFARAQAVVRRAVLAAGARLGIGDDVFWLPLDELDGDLDPVDARARAGAARAAAERARQWDMPVDPRDPAAGKGAIAGEWRGVGRGFATGRVKRLVAPTIVPPGQVVVARAITPAIVVLVPGAAALVSETGGILAHGAAIARELGIPFVVGCAGVWDAVADGDRVEVDGDAGVVRRLRQTT